MQTIHSHGHWKGEAWICLPIEYEGHRFGLLSLGPRQDRQPYSRHENEVLQRVTVQAARTIYLDLGSWLPDLLPLGAGIAPNQAAGPLGAAGLAARGSLPATVEGLWEGRL